MKKYLAIISFIVIMIALGVYWIYYLKKAHSTFENYYAFRGCVQLLSKSDEYGYCKAENGSIMKIVKYKDRWFLAGDLPSGRFFDF
ncbi:TPA: hypothetical protein DD449_01140 [Candidatus Berkelbacteria bacterium]|uniref:Uncharacterized protein n=1 Tax=Berkelbacteria bacterium GW2011_GWE1_39_12 TaxID=1618337 RepID=A0A0G4B3U8_9BACT|nr:MAG: hypothetical protein UT28_C0001G0859 [Berkelbacteria bacterium GW2011_GWE1_39_12]HBO60277.1 hypothetical protein [Candidatus Berkelbacteria bacterium]